MRKGHRLLRYSLFIFLALAIPAAMASAQTRTPTPTRTFTRTRTVSPTSTPTTTPPSPAMPATMTPTPTPTYTETRAFTFTPTWTPTGTSTGTPTSATATPTPTPTPTTGVNPWTPKIDKFGICAADPWRCVFAARLEPNIIVALCSTLPCLVLDPMPQNCIVKWTCPGCGPSPECPAYYHLLFDGTLKSWQPRIVDGNGKAVAQKRRRVGNNLAISFRPSEALSQAGSIGKYVLVLEPGKGVRAGIEYPIHVRLEVSNRSTPDTGWSRSK